MKKSTLLFIFEHLLFITLIVGLYTHIGTLNSTAKKNESSKKTLSRQVASLKKQKKDVKLLKYFLQIEKETEAIRGLHAQELIDYNVIPKAELKAFLERKFNQQYPEDFFIDMVNALKTIGLIDENVNLKKVLLDLFQEQIAAFYDYHDRKLYYVANSFFTPNIKKMFISHEIVHALQDQKYNLSKMGIDNRTNDDHVLALSAILEGDAMYCMRKYYAGHINIGLVLDLFSTAFSVFKQAEFDKAPSYVKTSMLFPYTKGLDFITAFYHEDSEITIDEVFRNPPQSTEQILHIEKYIAGEIPVYPLLPDLSDALTPHKLRIITNNVLGELGVRELLQQHISSPHAIEAAAGWGSDQYIVFENESTNERGFMIFSLWDSPKDTMEFYTAYLQWLKQKHALSDDAIYETINDAYITITPPDTTSPKKTVYIIHNDASCLIIFSQKRMVPILKNLLKSTPFTQSEHN